MQWPCLEERQAVVFHRLGSASKVTPRSWSPRSGPLPCQDHSQIITVIPRSRLTLGQDYCRLESFRRSGSPPSHSHSRLVSPQVIVPRSGSLLGQDHPQGCPRRVTSLQKSMHHHILPYLTDTPPIQGPPTIWVSSGSSWWDEKPPAVWDGKTTCGRPPGSPHLIWRRAWAE